MGLKDIAISFLILLVLLVGLAVHAGVAVVHVKTPDAQFWIPVPLALGHVAGYFINLPLPKEARLSKFLDYRQDVAQLVRQLQRLPDVDLLEVINPREHVRIYKNKNSLCIYVDSEREKVRVRLPLKALDRFIETMGKPSVHVGDLVACLEWQHPGELVHVTTPREEVMISIW